LKSKAAPLKGILKSTTKHYVSFSARNKTSQAPRIVPTTMQTPTAVSPHRLDSSARKAPARPRTGDNNDVENPAMPAAKRRKGVGGGGGVWAAGEGGESGGKEGHVKIEIEGGLASAGSARGRGMTVWSGAGNQGGGVSKHRVHEKMEYPSSPPPLRVEHPHYSHARHVRASGDYEQEEGKSTADVDATMLLIASSLMALAQVSGESDFESPTSPCASNLCRTRLAPIITAFSPPQRTAPTTGPSVRDRDHSRVSTLATPGCVASQAQEAATRKRKAAATADLEPKLRSALALPLSPLAVTRLQTQPTSPRSRSRPLALALCLPPQVAQSPQQPGTVYVPRDFDSPRGARDVARDSPRVARYSPRDSRGRHLWT